MSIATPSTSTSDEPFHPSAHAPPSRTAVPEGRGAVGWLAGLLALVLVCWGMQVQPASAQQLNRVAPDVLQQAKADFHGADMQGKDGPLSSVGMELALLYHEHQQFEANGSAGSFESKAITNAPVSGDRVVVDVIARNGTDALKADLRQLGARDVAAFRNLVSATVPIDEIPQMAGLTSLRGARLARAATPQRAERSTPESAASSPLVGATDSQGDVAMNTDDVRSNFGIDGNGIKVGVLSDSYDNSNSASTSAADDISSGDLPPSDRIDVLDDEVTGSDEGRAMMQLIYDVAPGSDLAFHTAFKGQANFAQGIVELADAGSDVIVDDIFYFAEPFFQDGVIAQAVDQVSGNGVPYFSSAGNSADQSYESTSFSTITTNDGTPVYDFDPTASSDTLQQVTVPTQRSVIISFQWDDPVFSLTGDPSRAADGDLDIYLLSKTGDVLASSTEDNLSSGDPIEVFSFQNDGSIDADNDGNPDTTFNIKIEKAGGSDPGRIKYVWFRSMTVNEFDTQSSSSVGHSIASGGAGVGAAFYQDTPEFGQSPPLPEGFTALGGTPILFNDDGTRKGSPEVRDQPRFTAPDGTNTTFFGFDQEGDGFPNFFGTSAAAPHAAAVAALQLQADPGQSPSQIYTALSNNAVDMEASGFDFLTGAGLIDAEQTITSVANEPNIEVVPTSTVDFGPRFFDQSNSELFTKPSVTVRVTNVGTAPLDVSSVTLTGSSFAVTSGGISTGTLAEDAEELATITFDPSSTGNFSESYDIDSNDPDSPTVNVELRGESLLPPVVNLSASSFFEALEPGQTATQSFTVGNTGDNPLEYDVFAEALGLGPFSPDDVAATPTTATAKRNVTAESAMRSLVAPDRTTDQAFNVSEFIYTLDDSSVETNLGFGSNADLFALNAFQAQDGATTITALASAFGPSLSVGSDVEFLLYEDPNDDGNPADANLLRTVTTTTEVSGGGNLQIEPISPTQVEGVFFVAILVPDTPNFPLPLDESSNQGASWISSADAGTFDTSDLSGSGNASQDAPSLTADINFPGNWVLRAQGAYAAFEPVSGTVSAGNSDQVDVTFDGTSLATGRYQANAAVTSNDPATPKVDVPFDLFIADAVGEATLSSSNTTSSFDDGNPNSPEPGFAVNLSGVSGSGTVTAMRFDDPPSNVSGLASGESASKYRWFIRDGGNVQFDASSELRFVRADIPNPGFDQFNADDITVYRRSSFGTGTFNSLTTSFDDGGTSSDLSDDAIVATGATDFSEFTFGSDSAPLPVEIASFTARRDGQDVVLSWRTASETNNAGFRVEKKAENASSWTDTGSFIEGNGTTTEAQTYQYRVEDMEPNTYSFRLKSVDADGTQQVGPKTSATVQLRSAYKVSPVHPNPVTNQGRIEVQVKEKQNVRVVLYNVLGQKVSTLHDGTMKPSATHTMTIDASSLASGVYFVRVDGDAFRTTKKVTLTR